MQQCAFANARRSHDRNHLTLLNGEVEIPKHVQLLASDTIGFVEGCGGEEWH
jgi:hypothetical protein